MKRPSLTALSFLKHLFSPKSNPLPTGIRKRKLVGLKGRSKARLASYNRMEGKSQEILKRSGLREEYLKGNASLADAKKVLRQEALKVGAAKPTPREKQEAARKKAIDKKISAAAFTAQKMAAKLRDGGKEPDVVNMIKRLSFLPDDMLITASNMPYEDIRRIASDDDAIIRLPDGTEMNPFWYK